MVCWAHFVLFFLVDDWRTMRKMDEKQVDIECETHHTFSCSWNSSKKNMSRKNSNSGLCSAFGIFSPAFFFLFTYYIDIITRHFGHTRRWWNRNFQHHTHCAAASAARTDGERVSKPIWVDWNCFLFVLCKFFSPFRFGLRQQISPAIEIYIFLPSSNLDEAYSDASPDSPLSILFARVSFIIWLYIYILCSVFGSLLDAMCARASVSQTVTTTWSIWLRCCLRQRMIWKVR